MDEIQVPISLLAMILRSQKFTRPRITVDSLELFKIVSVPEVYLLS